MLNRLRKFTEEREQGFTLIELLVVIIIIGILAAIAIPVFLNQRKKGVDASLKSDLKSAATQVETWITDNPSEAVVGAVANGTVDPATVEPADSALAGFKVTKGNIVEVVAGAEVGSYCIQAYNAGASTAKSDTVQMLYKSDEGGLAGTGTCTP